MCKALYKCLKGIMSQFTHAHEVNDKIVNQWRAVRVGAAGMAAAAPILDAPKKKT